MIWGVIPAKDYGQAKSRLAPVLTADQRHRLARGLFLHVASAALQVTDRLAVLTDSAEVAADAHRLGALVLPDRTSGLGALVDDALATLRGDAALVLMADLPQLAVRDLRTLIHAPGPAAVPDRHGLGTNALWTPLPCRPTCFGNPDSFERHLRAGFEPRPLPSLALDLDLPDDLRAERHECHEPG